MACSCFSAKKTSQMNPGRPTSAHDGEIAAADQRTGGPHHRRPSPPRYGPRDPDPMTRVNPCRVKRSSIPVSARYFAKETLCFLEINPQSYIV